MESHLEIGNIGSTIKDSLFPAFYTETKLPYRGGLRVLVIGALLNKLSGDL